MKYVEGKKNGCHFPFPYSIPTTTPSLTIRIVYLIYREQTTTRRRSTSRLPPPAPPTLGFPPSSIHPVWPSPLLWIRLFRAWLPPSHSGFRRHWQHGAAFAGTFNHINREGEPPPPPTLHRVTSAVRERICWDRKRIGRRV